MTGKYTYKTEKQHIGFNTQERGMMKKLQTTFVAIIFTQSFQPLTNIQKLPVSSHLIMQDLKVLIRNCSFKKAFG